MANYELIFDLGSEYISAMITKDGFSDKIPSVVAYNGDTKQIIVVGVEAIRAGITRAGTRVVRPILEGAIIDSDGMKALVSSLMERLGNNQLNAFGRYSVTCIVPCGMISNDKRNIESVFLGLGVKQVSFVETPIADSMQLFGEFHTRQGIILNIGYDCTDIAVVNDKTIVSGCTVYHSGKHLTEAIVDRIKSKYMIQISFDQAETLKLNCASLYPNDTSVMQVSGQNVQHGNVEVVSISAKELYDTLVDFNRKYVQIISALLSSIPQDISPAVKSGGIMLCGGGAKLAGLDMFLNAESGLPVKVSNHAEETSILGMFTYNK